MSNQSRHRDQTIYYGLYSAQPEDVPVRLRQASVVVVGLGGIGSELVRHLASAGVGTIVCIDADCVHPANLNRQHLYAPADIGRAKVDCVCEAMQRLFPATVCVGVLRHIVSAADLNDAIGTVARCDYIACCADEPIGGIEVACILAAGERGCTVGFCAMQLRRGYWGMARGTAPQRSALRFFTIAALTAVASSQAVLRGSASWTNTVIAAFFAESVIMQLSGLKGASPQPDGLTAFDFDTMRASSTILFSEECPWIAPATSC